VSRLGAVRPREALRTKSGAAGLSILSNSVLIALKLAAGAITGSIAIITEAVHSSIDLVASIIAFVSVRAASEPADADHPYGHERVENLAAVIEGMLIVIGAGIIIFEATNRLVDPPGEIDALAVGIAVAAFSTLANVVVSTFLFRRARELRSPALEADAAHLQTDAMTSAGLLVGLGLVEVTGVVAFDAITALLIAVAIVAAGIRILSRSSRILVDEAPPPEELDRIEQAIASAGMPEVAGYHKLRARRSGSHRHIDLHVQFRSGTTLERAHELAHELRGAIEDAIPYSDVLIHVEPESSVTDDAENDQPLRHGRL
jgi:cation diffusion facilitator family transporter